jgi:mannose-1-phosphate guanylyltransferase
MNDVYAVIMAGGAGTRFWPASRELRPKQLLPLAAPGESLLAATVRRIAPIVPPERVYIATGAKLVDATARDLPGVPRANLLAEPVARNTAPCIGWATATIARKNPEALVMVLPSDHYISDEPGFLKVIERALAGARAGHLATIGIVPTRPETGYGYIEVGAAVAELASHGVSEVARFVEKPDRARAEGYVAGGKHLWNAGMFFFRARDMAAAIERHLPELAGGLARIDAAAARGDEARELAATFPTLPSVSIDNGVMEKASRLAVVKGSFGWNDLGSWESAWELAPKDAAGNAAPEGTITVEAAGNLVSDLTTPGKPKRVYALVGVSNLVVVETDDAVLVMSRERAQDVKAVVAELKKRGDGAKT